MAVGFRPFSGVRNSTTYGAPNQVYRGRSSVAWIHATRRRVPLPAGVPSQTIDIGAVIETSATDVVTVTKAADVIAVTEAQVLGAGTPAWATDLTSASESGTTGAITHARAADLGAVGETSTTQPPTGAKVADAAVAAETGTTSATTPAWARDIIGASESGTVDAVTHARTIDILVVTESGTATIDSPIKAVDIVAVLETNTIAPVEASQGLSADIGAVVESQIVSGITVTKVMDVASASETSTAPAAELPRAQDLGASAEAGSTGGITPTKAADVAATVESQIVSAAEAVRATDLSAVTELDIISGITHTFNRFVDIGAVTEADVAAGVTHTMAVDLGAAGESDTVGALEFPQTIDIDGVVELSIASAASVSANVDVFIGAVLENNIVSGITPAKAITIPVHFEVQEVGSAQPFRELVIGGVTETGVAGLVEPYNQNLVVIGPVTETGTVAGIEVAKAASVAPASEETHLARPTDWPKAADLGTANELQSSAPVESLWATDLGVSIEQDITSGITRAKVADLDGFVELNLAGHLSFSLALSVDILPVIEDDIVAAPNVGQGKTYDMGGVTETGVVGGILINMGQTFVIGGASETSIVAGVTPAKATEPLGAASELGESLFNIVVTKAADVATAGTETSSASSPTGVHAWNVGGVAESGTGFGIVATRVHDLTGVTEVDLVRGVIALGPVFADIGAVLENDLVFEAFWQGPRELIDVEGVWMPFLFNVERPVVIDDVLIGKVVETDTVEIRLPRRTVDVGIPVMHGAVDVGFGGVV